MNTTTSTHPTPILTIDADTARALVYALHDTADAAVVLELDTDQGPILLTLEQSIGDQIPGLYDLDAPELDTQE